jgi:hypothetical protein
MPKENEPFAYTAFAYETLDPGDHDTVGRIIEQINADEGPLVTIAAGDLNYLRFLREDAVAQLDLRLKPDDEDVAERAIQTHDALHAYEALINPDS